MKRHSLVKTWTFLFVCVFGLTRCTKHESVQSSPPASEVIAIGEVDSLTGNEATYGVSTNQGAKLAIEEVNAAGGIQGKKIKLISTDAQGKPDEGARGITRLITKDKVVAVITGATSSNALAMAPIAQQNKVPLIATGATNPQLTEIGDYIFRNVFIDSFQGRVMAKFTLETLKFKKIAILRDVRSDYSVGLADVYSEVIKAGGGEIIMDQSYSAGDIDFKSQLTAIRSKKPDGIFIPGYYTDVSLIARQARELGIQTTLLGADGWESPKLKEIGGKSIGGSFFSSFYAAENPAPAVKAFFTKYKQLYNSEPDGIAAMGYEGAQVLLDAIRRAKTLDSAGIRDALAATKNLETVTGKMSLNEKRDAVKSVVVLKVDSDGTARFHMNINPSL